MQMPKKRLPYHFLFSFLRGYRWDRVPNERRIVLSDRHTSTASDFLLAVSVAYKKGRKTMERQIPTEPRTTTARGIQDAGASAGREGTGERRRL